MKTKGGHGPTLFKILFLKNVVKLNICAFFVYKLGLAPIEIMLDP
jgi:hypothetical protein